MYSFVILAHLVIPTYLITVVLSGCTADLRLRGKDEGAGRGCEEGKSFEKHGSGHHEREGKGYLGSREKG